MGWRFSLEYANVVAYMLAPDERKSTPPRLTPRELEEFLGSMQGEYRQSPPFISSNDHWVREVTAAAQKASQWLEAQNVDGKEFLDDQVLTTALSGIKRALGHYELIGLAVGGSEDERELKTFVEYAAYSSGHHAIFLIPDSTLGGVKVLDPFPSVALIAEQPENWPGILFWSWRGASAFAPLDDAPRLYQDLIESLKHRGVIKTLKHRGDSIERILDSYRSRNSSKKLLHLSDLHFGTKEAAEHEAYLSACLDPLLSSVNRVVITGDLFNNPRREDAIQFRNFRSSLFRRTGKDVIIVPGNHDQKWLGNVGSPLKELANLEWSSLVVDDEMQCVFFCFDSSKDADLARGKITRQQMMDIATLYETKAVGNSRIKDYLSIALIHHHPFSFESGKESKINRWLSFIGITDEQFLRMEDADEFLNWCAKRKIPLVLHGHKHVQRYMRKITAEFKKAERTIWNDVTAVGCGTSLGAESKPMSYNILTWDSASKRWGSSFFADPGDGSGFTRQYVTLQDIF